MDNTGQYDSHPPQEQIQGVNQPSNNFLKNILSRKLILVGIVLLLLVALSLVFIVVSGRKTGPTSPGVVSGDKTWEIIVAYNAQKDQLTLKKLSLLDKKIIQDNRSAQFSHTQIQAVDSAGNILYQSKIIISQQLIYNILDTPASGSGGFLPSPPPSLDTVIYVPYDGKTAKILIINDNKKLLEINVAGKKSSMNFPFVQRVEAATCNPLVTVFISDGYTDFNRFHQDVDRLKSAFLSTAPYSGYPSMFDFKAIDNSVDLGCRNGILTCINNTQIEQIGYAQYPNASKFIVITNRPFGGPDGTILGVTNAIGGDKEVFPNASDGVHADLVSRVGAHEFLGHAVGQLYDRYVTNNPSYGNLYNNIRSNCTDNSAGEAFWKAVGVNTVVRGCGNPTSMYGSSALTCPGGSTLISGGNPSSIMSAAGCGGPSFDTVEQNWISTQILPMYTSCSGAGGPTATPTPISSGGGGVSHKIFGVVFNDLNNNGTKDPGEPGISGAAIALSGAATNNTTTDASGNYSFPNVSAGSYNVTLNYSGVTSNVSVTITDNTSDAQVDFRLVGSGPNPTIAPITPTSTPTPTPTPLSGGGNGGDQPTPTPEQTYTCGSCSSSVVKPGTINIGQLCCTPN